MMPKKKITAVLIGAGLRGNYGYASYSKKNSGEIEFAAVAEPNEKRREAFKNEYHLPEDMCFESWEELLDMPKLADAALVCTQDKEHFKPAVQALEKGYHLLLEKPMSTEPLECIVLGEYAKKYKRVFAICHILRYTPFFTAIKRLLDEGKIGKLISIQHNENVGFWHYAHSFVRGNWRREDQACPMILAKSCHDMDLMLWFTGADCISVASFGGLTHFKKENQPAGAPLRCIEGCQYENGCPYDAKKIYLGRKADWAVNAMTDDVTEEGIIKALKEGPYGRCVYCCDNDVVDHQVVSLVFENGVTAAFTMCAFTNQLGRTIKLMGTKGEIRAAIDRNEYEIEIIDFATEKSETVQLESIEDDKGHGGGDYGIMREFVRLVAADSGESALTSADISVQGHIISFAAEKSRVENRVINIKEYIAEINN